MQEQKNEKLRSLSPLGILDEDKEENKNATPVIEWTTDKQPHMHSKFKVTYKLTPRGRNVDHIQTLIVISVNSILTNSKI